MLATTFYRTKIGNSYYLSAIHLPASNANDHLIDSPPTRLIKKTADHLNMVTQSVLINLSPQKR